MSITRYLSLKLLQELCGYEVQSEQCFDKYYHELMKHVNRFDHNEVCLMFANIEVKSDIEALKEDFISLLAGVVIANNNKMTIKTLISVFIATRLLMKVYIIHGRYDNAILFPHWMRDFLESEDYVWKGLVDNHWSLFTVAIGAFIISYTLKLLWR